MIDLELSNKVALKYRNAIEAQGFKVIVSSDFKKLKKQAKKFEHDISPHFDTKYNTFFRDEAFWIGAYMDGECVGYCAAKKQPVGNEGLINYVKRYWKRVYRHKSETPIKFSDWQMSRLDIKGTLIYSGAWYVNPDFQKYGIGKNLGRYIVCYSFMEWREADYFYIFMENRDARSGLGAALELTDQVPSGLQWESHPSQAKEDYWFLGISKETFQDLVKAEVLRSEKN